jgi:hypothetical protein
MGVGEDLVLGCGHVLNRLYQSSGDAGLAEAARSLFDFVIDAGEGGEGIAGLRFYKGGWRTLPGFLAGAAGVCLALLAACQSDEPKWDRVLLLPPTSSRQHPGFPPAGFK